MILPGNSRWKPEMQRQTYSDLARAAAQRVRELDPWDLETHLAANPGTLLLDIREREEFASGHIPGSVNVPRGILEAATEWNYPETVEELVLARQRPVVVICRSGNRSAMAAETLGLLGYENVVSLRLGIRAWNDDEMPLVDNTGTAVDSDAAATHIDPELRPDQIDPARRKNGN
jgi:rhodanese-related sulfurtransferase